MTFIQGVVEAMRKAGADEETIARTVVALVDLKNNIDFQPEK